LTEEQEELDLLAFRYVAGEMTDQEAAAFEARLADDHAARLTVSRVVGLTQLVADAKRSLPSPATTKRKRMLGRAVQSLGWMTIGAAVAVCAVNIVPRVVIRSGSAPAADAVVFARLQSSHEWTAAELERWLDDSAPQADDQDPALAARIPSWVFAAGPGSVKGEQP
jgi:hypothetical protein